MFSGEVWRMTIDKLGEFGLIARLAKQMQRPGDKVVRALGDDTAVFRVSDDRLVLATCDAQIQGVHFDVAKASAEQIGRRAAAVNLSDIAAMGGAPTFALASLAAPGSTAVRFIEGIYVGLTAGLAAFGAEVVGGNTARLPERILVDVTLLGEVAPGRCLTRDGAEPGDLICVTGALGESRAGLSLLTLTGIPIDPRLEAGALDAHFTPTPRVREGQFLGESGQVTACIDVSDGLIGDAGHIAEASGVSLRIDAGRVPVGPAAKLVAEHLGADPLEYAANGGEDFELLFTAGPGAAAGLLDALERRTGTRAAIIGEVRPGPARVTVERAGRPVDLPQNSFDHFK
jgi:thiamine-monophosphate kinase